MQTKNTKARSMIGTTETRKQKDTAGLLDELMRGGHSCHG